MSKTKRKEPKIIMRLSQDATFFLSKLFHWIQPELTQRVRSVDLTGKTLTHRAVEASCECIEAGYLRIDEETHIYYLSKLFAVPPLKLQRVREAYQAFDIFVPEDVTGKKAFREALAYHGNPILETMTDLSRIQTDLLCALKFPDMTDAVARIHVQHAIDAIRRLSTEGVKGLETVL